MPHYADILGAILPCISDKEEKIRVVSTFFFTTLSYNVLHSRLYICNKHPTLLALLTTIPQVCISLRESCLNQLMKSYMLESETCLMYSVQETSLIVLCYFIYQNYLGCYLLILGTLGVVSVS